MSISLMTEAWKLQGLSSTQKLVLLSLADNANDQGECYPSIATIVSRTCLSERTVQSAIRSLSEKGYVKSMARLGTSTVYRLNMAPSADKPEPANPRKSRTPANVAPPAVAAPPQQLHPSPAADAPPPPQQPHPRGATVAPKPSVNRQLNRQRTVKGADAPSDDLPDWLPLEAWAMYDRYRQSKSKKDWTADAQRLAVIRLGKLRTEGHDPQAVIENTVLNGWSGLFPLKPDHAGRPAKNGVNKHADFGKQDYHAGVTEDGHF